MIGASKISNDMAICWDMLPRVSRSFSLAIKVLPQPMAGQMMLSYIIYRIIDTIEDCSTPQKKELFGGFVSLLSQKSVDMAQVGRMRNRMLKEIRCTYEKELLQNLPSIARAYYSLPNGARASIIKWGKVMAEGMYEFQNRPIRTFADQDRYSYYVAGVVGYLFNDLLYHNRIITQKTRKELHVYAKKFGLALQKVNILRDVASDIPSRRYYWPKKILEKHSLDYEALLKKENRRMAMRVLNEEIENALEYLYSGMRYIISLPQNALKVRMFCLIPLFMAIESYVKCINNSDVFDVGSKVKISRVQVHEIVAKCALWGTSNERLVTWFLETISKANPALAKNKQAQMLLAANRVSS